MNSWYFSEYGNQPRVQYWTVSRNHPRNDRKGKSAFINDPSGYIFNATDKKIKTTIGRRIINFISAFFKISTIHGLDHLTATERHFTEHVLWAAAVALAVAGTLFMSSIQWYRYQDRPTVISIEKDYKNWNTTFPTVVLCPSEQINHEKMNLLAQKYDPENPEQFVKFFTQLAASVYTTFGNLTDYKGNVPPDKYLDVILQASFNFTYLLSSSYTRIKDGLDRTVTEIGTCDIFNSAVAQYFTPENYRQAATVVPRETALNLGSPLGGEMNTQFQDMSSLAKAAIISNSDLPDSATVWMTLNGSEYVNLETLALPVWTTEEVRTLTIRQRKCRFMDESNLQISNIYTYTQCRMECRLKLALELCRCIPYFYNKIKGQPYCDVEGLRCLGKHGEHLTNLRHPITKEKVRCRCYPMCSETFFTLDKEAKMQWALPTQYKVILMTFPKTRLKREIIFGLPELLVAVGATAGLFMGCSVLSFMEILYFITFRLAGQALQKNKTTNVNLE